jgi:hypothetical protein
MSKAIATDIPFLLMFFRPRRAIRAEAQHQANVSRALTAAAFVFAGTALVAGEVGAAAATRPPVQNNTYYVNQYNNGY